MRVFWRKGFLGASLTDLTRAMRVSRPSLYATFGNKETLFRKAEALRPDGWIPAYNRACLLATTGRAADALQLLDTLAARHPLSFGLIEGDRDLAPVRALPGYAHLRGLLSGAADEDDAAAEEDAG